MRVKRMQDKDYAEMNTFFAFCNQEKFVLENFFFNLANLGAENQIVIKIFGKLFYFWRKKLLQKGKLFFGFSCTDYSFFVILHSNFRKNKN